MLPEQSTARISSRSTGTARAGAIPRRTMASSAAPQAFILSSETFAPDDHAFGFLLHGRAAAAPCRVAANGEGERVADGLAGEQPFELHVAAAAIGRVNLDAH